jgi:Cytochrome c
MYANYCASCHGVRGKGDGPAAPAFKHSPTNLTFLATNNGGKFPTLLVLHTVKFGPNAPAHGNVQTPAIHLCDIFEMLSRLPRQSESNSTRA